jgi:hypothetical protein
MQSRSASGQRRSKIELFRVIGKATSSVGPSYVATLVERHSRYVMLIKVANKDTEGVVTALIKHSQKLPGELYRSLTWDRGKELADHQRLTLATDIEVYFCDPRSPWQRGSNENTNRLLRQYLPRAPTSLYTARPSSTPSPGSSTSVLERPCSIKRQRRSSPSVVPRSVEPTARTGHWLASASRHERTFAFHNRSSANYRKPLTRLVTLSTDQL